MRFSFLLMIVVLVLTACQGETSDEPPPDPIELVTEAADNIRSAETFRMEAIHSGVDYLISVYITEGTDPVNVAFRRAVAQYVSPGLFQADVRVLLGGLAVDIDVFSNGPAQWFKLAGTGWINEDFAAGFDPQTLIAEDTGFQAALQSLEDLQYAGATSLEDGTDVYHLTGTARGPDVTALLVGLIEAEGLVPVDVYIDRETLYPVRFVIVQPETDPDNPTTWTVDVYDVDAEPELAPPDGAV